MDKKRKYSSQEDEHREIVEQERVNKKSKHSSQEDEYWEILEQERVSNRVQGTEDFHWLKEIVDLHELKNRIQNEPAMHFDDFKEGHVVIFQLLDDDPSNLTRAIQEEEILKTNLKVKSRIPGEGAITLKSFWAVWNSDPKLKETINNSSNPHETMWQCRVKFNYKIATTFMPGYAKALYEYFDVERVLDPCAGWGDRLTGAALSTCVKSYVAFDPNIHLRPGYAEIMKVCGNSLVDLKSKSLHFSNDFYIHSLPFEIGSRELLRDESFDFAFTSPPFFDYEMYTRDNPEYKDWIAEFYVPLFQETCRCLKLGKFFGIHIGDTSAGTISHFLFNGATFVSDFQYRFKIGLRGMKSNEIRSVYFYEKVASKVYRSLYIKGATNPPLKCETVSAMVHNRNIRLHLLSDATTVGGSKQRLLGRILSKLPYEEFVYAGPDVGLAQVALGVACSHYGRKGTVFLNTAANVKLPLFTELAKNLGVYISRSSTNENRTLKASEAAAEEYVKQSPETRFLVPFGLKDKPGSILFDTFQEALREALEPLGLLEKQPRRLWVVAGSSFLVNVLHSLMPATIYHIIQVGKTVYSDLVEHINHRLYVAPEKFAEDAKHQPPYSTVKWYDAKLWQFVLQYGEDGDFIFNVGSTDNKPNEYLGLLP